MISLKSLSQSIKRKRAQIAFISRIAQTDYFLPEHWQEDYITDRSKWPSAADKFNLRCPCGKYYQYYLEQNEEGEIRPVMVCLSDDSTFQGMINQLEEDAKRRLKENSECTHT